MNLENFNVVELSQQENVEANGGTLWGEIAYAVGYACSAIVNGVHNAVVTGGSRSPSGIGRGTY